MLDQFKIVFVFLDSVKISDKEYKAYDEVTADFAAGVISPKALKESAAACFQQFWKNTEAISKLAEALKAKK